jgi:diadenosine tetraphosphatase ApaH/serine/threonine PP2A family protein phosphatase
VGQEQVDQFDANWVDDTLLNFLFGEDFVDTLMLLANTVRKVVASQPVLAECGVPARVFGDIHGQLRDLLILFRTFGTPGDRKSEGGQSVSFVFNGDFVDRGSHSLEVVGLLFAMKIMLPEKVFLVRGNHEDRAMNERYGFENECYSVLGADVGPKTYELIHRAFDELPLACLINDKVLVVHGGLGDGRFTLNDIRGVERPLKERQLSNDPMVWNMLWSDPIEDDKADDQEGIFGVHQSPRSSTGLFKFGWNVTKTFCAANGLGLIIRSHQSKAGSLGFSVMHDRMLVRVFSARDYEEHGNDGAVLLVTAQTDKNPLARTGALAVRPQVVRSVTKGAGKKRVTRRKKRRGSIGPSFNMKEMELLAKQSPKT